MTRFFSLTLILLLVACAASTPVQTSTPAPTLTPTSTPTPEPTLTSTPIPTTLPTSMPTPFPTPTEIPPAMPKNVHDLTVYNYETQKDEVISPTFNKDMNTWVWKNGKGEVRRFIDLENGHIFAQTESVGQYNQPENQRIIYQVDTYFGWEADLTNIDKIPTGNTAVGSQYIAAIHEHFPGIINISNSQTSITFEIVHGSYDQITDKSKISSRESYTYGGPIAKNTFFWPIYDPKNNTYILKIYMTADLIKDPEPIRYYTEDMLNLCPVSNGLNFPIVTVNIKIPKNPLLSTSTAIPTKMPTPLPVPAETQVVITENIKPMEVYNYTTRKTETIHPTINKDLNTWVWKNSTGEVRRFIDPETGHVFSQTESVNQQIVYQVDKDFGWEADLTNINKNPDSFAKLGLQYLADMHNFYPDAFPTGNGQTRLILKIVHGGYDDIADKSKISFSYENSVNGVTSFYLFPAYDKKNNAYVLTAFYIFTPPSFVNQFTLLSLTYELLNRCPTSNPPKHHPIGIVNFKIPKKLIQ